MSNAIQSDLIHSLRSPLNLSPRRAGFFHLPVVLALVCLALTSTSRAVSPPPDGGYLYENTAEGTDALFSLTYGYDNTAIGFKALFNNTDGAFNTAVGDQALLNNTTGTSNTAIGSFALYYNTLGALNTALGEGALIFNTTGNTNMAVGSFALAANTTGSNNVAVGRSTLTDNTTGSSNIALGESAGSNLTTGKNNIDIGNKGVAGESAAIRIGKKGTHTVTHIAGISGTTVAGGVGVVIDTGGRLGTINSSSRYKEAIRPMDKASEALLALKPVTFRYKHDLDPDGIPQFGLVAEEVAKVAPDLVARDEEGKPYTVRYEAVNAMLINEFLKEHRKMEEQAKINQQQEAKIAQQQKNFDVTIAQQQKQIAALTSTLQEQALQIQKVSARLAAADQSAPHVVSNDQSKNLR